MSTKKQANDVKIAAAYIRVSTDDQLEYSPDSQLDVIRDYARRNNKDRRGLVHRSGQCRINQHHIGRSLLFYGSISSIFLQGDLP